MATVPEVVRVELPLPASENAKQLCTTCTSQSSTIKQCSDYSNATAVQTTVTAMDAAVAQLQTTDGKIDNLEAQILALKKTRVSQMATVHLTHANVEAAINARSNGDPQAAQQWTGKLKTRAKPVAVTADTTPPTGATLRTVQRTHGMVKGRCNPEPSAEGYLFQTGGDPLHPETWPPPFFAHGHTFSLRNQTVGQTVYMRMAVVRRGSVQSGWTQVLQVVVR